MKGHEWNKFWFEERMSFLSAQPPATPVAEEIWRTVPDSDYKLQVSNTGKMRRTSLAKILAGKKGKEMEVDDYTYYTAYSKAFNKHPPLFGNEDS